jgi:hypothetical protein
VSGRLKSLVLLVSEHVVASKFDFSVSVLAGLRSGHGVYFAGETLQQNDISLIMITNIINDKNKNNKN